MAKKIDYSAWIGAKKTAINSAWMLIPFALAVLAQVPIEYAWLASPVAYFLKNYLANRNK